MNEHGGDRKQGDKKEKVTLKERGNSKEYRIAKLKRDHPEVAERLIAGEFKTVAEAEINPGSGSRSDLVKPSNNITRLDKPTRGTKRSYTLNRLSRENH